VTEAHWDEVIAVNLRFSIVLYPGGAAGAARSHGSVVMVSSVAGLVPATEASSMRISKAGWSGWRHACT